MKRVLLITFLICLTFHGFAQPQAGKIFVGGSLSVNNNSWKTNDGGTTSTESKTFNYDFSPAAGYFLSSRFAVGLGLGLSGSVIKYPNAFVDKSSSLGFSISPFGRYYISQGNFGVYAQAKVSAEFGANKSFMNDVSTIRNYHSFSTAFSPGIYYYVSPKLALEAQLGGLEAAIRTNETGSDSKDIYTSFGLHLSTGLTLGFKIILN